MAAALILQAAAYVTLFDRHFLSLPVEPREQLALGCAFLLPTLASVGFWTLIGRSTLAGMVFTATAQLFVVGVLSFFVDRFTISAAGQMGMFIGCGAVYTILFFWLTWRRISNFEVRQLVSEAKSSSESLAAGGWRPDWLRCRSTSGFLNLVRKEIQLQRPLFVIAAICVLFWVVTYILLIAQSSRTTFAEIVFSLTLGAYIPLTALLAGCISLSEEKNLGITAWHHTFPIPVRRQWAIKLAVGLTTWILFGLALPYILTRVGLTINSTRLLRDIDERTWLVISAIGTGLFVTSFWSTTLAGNAIRAVLGGLAIFATLWGSVIFGIWTLVFFFGPLRPFIFFSAWPLLFALLVIPPLLQSLHQFRYLQSSGMIAIKHSAILAALTLGIVLGFFLLLSLMGFRVDRIT